MDADRPSAQTGTDDSRGLLELAKLDTRLYEQMANADFIDLLNGTFTVLERTTARVAVGKTGTDMTQFPTPAHAASWAGLCPGNAMSAGKHFSSGCCCKATVICAGYWCKAPGVRRVPKTAFWLVCSIALRPGVA